MVLPRELGFMILLLFTGLAWRVSLIAPWLNGVRLLSGRLLLLFRIRVYNTEYYSYCYASNLERHLCKSKP
jgi:hypothetical protein